MRLELAAALLHLLAPSPAAPAGDAPATITRDPDGHDDVDGAEDRRLRVHLDTQALGGAWVHRDAPMVGEPRQSLSLGVGLARPSLVDDGSALGVRPVLGLGFGYVLDNRRTVLGAKVALTLDGYGLDDQSRMVAIGGRFVPYLHWMFRPGHAMRPYLEARAGLGGQRLVRNGGEVATAVEVMYPLVGAGGGVHMFPREWVSFDLGLDLDYLAPLVRTQSTDVAEADPWRKRADVLAFGVTLGLSTWF